MVNPMPALRPHVSSPANAQSNPATTPHPHAVKKSNVAACAAGVASSNVRTPRVPGSTSLAETSSSSTTPPRR